MASDVCWNNLPSIVLLEIFKRISHEERINASSTCKEWRKALFFPNFWRDISISVFSKEDKNTVERCQFLTRSFVSSLRNVKIIFSYQKNYLSQVVSILSKLSANRQMQRLYLYAIGNPIWNSSLSHCNENLKLFLENVKNLDTLYINHSWLTLFLDENLKLSLEKHKDSLKCLGLGAVFSDLADSQSIQLPVDFALFKQLTILSLDHSWVTDDIVNQICSQKSLKRLTIHLEHVYTELRVKNETWTYFHESMPDCDLRINLIQGIDADVMQIFSDVMPVTHIKLLYCKQVDLQLMSIFSSLKELRSIWCIAEEDSELHITPVENPFVICAWTCKKLEELVIIGFQLDFDDLVGIARLGGSKLKRLDVCKEHIMKLFKNEYRPVWNSRNLAPSEVNKLNKSMSKELKRAWSPTDLSTFKKSNLSMFDNQIANIVEILSLDLQL